jgi:hypothetical protein
MSDNHINNNEEGKLLHGISRVYPFTLPDGYFDILPNRISARIESQGELKEFAFLSGIPKEQKFETPADYFEVAANDLECLFEVSSVPQFEKAKEPKLEQAHLEDYFAALDRKMVERLEAADELKDYAKLRSIDKKNNFAFDPEYFETIADRVKERKYAEVNRQPSFIEKIFAHILRPKMALSYSMVMIIGAAVVWFYLGSQEKVISGDCKTLACLEKNELLNEQNMNDFDSENLYEMVDVEDLDRQISTEGIENPEDNDSVNRN